MSATVRKGPWIAATAVLLVVLANSLSPQEKPAQPEKKAADNPRVERQKIRVPKFREIYAETPVTRAVDRGLQFLASKQMLSLIHI